MALVLGFCVEGTVSTGLRDQRGWVLLVPCGHGPPQEMVLYVPCVCGGQV